MNPALQIALEIAKYVLPSLVVLLATSTIVSKFIARDVSNKRVELLRESQGTSIRLRLQAYERLTVYIERIHPRSLIPRVYESGMTVPDS